jgi:GT2 family glycosyltransferase
MYAASVLLVNSISVIIVTYRPGPELLDCLRSIEYFVRCNYEVIICDNSPGDNVVLAELKQEFDNVTVLHDRANPGFGTANNSGAARAKHPYLLFINPDAALVCPIEDPTTFFSSNTGIVAGYCLDQENRYKQTVGHFPSDPKLLVLFSRRLNRRPPLNDGNFKERFVEIDYAEGSLYLVRSDVFRQVAGFDEDIFLYGEDYELSYRVWCAGYVNIIARDLMYQHAGGFNHSREPHIVNGLMHFAKKHLNYRKRLGVRFVLFARTCLLLSLCTTLSMISVERRKRLRPLLLSLRRTLEA